MAERVGKVERDWVPSTREVGARATYAFNPAPRAVAGPRISIRARLGATVGALNPRAIAGQSKAFPLVVIGLLAGLAQWQEGSFALLLPFIKVDMGFDFTFMLTLLSAVHIFTTIIAPLMGFLADRWRRVVMVRVGAAIGGAASLAAGLAPGPGALVVARLVGGLGPGIERPAEIPLLADYYEPDKRVRTYTFLQVATAAVYTTGFALMYVVLFKIGGSWRGVLIGTGALSLSLSLLALRLREPARGALERRAMGQSEADVARTPKPVSWSEAWRTLSSIRSLRRIWFATPFLTIAQSALISFLFFVLQTRIFAGDLRGPGAALFRGTNGVFVFIAVPPLLGVIGLAFAAPVAERLMREHPGRILFYAGLILGMQAGAMVGLMVIPYLPIAYLLLFAVQALGTAILPAQYTLLSAILPARVRGQGIQSIAPWQLLGLLVLPVAGVLADTYGVIAASVLLAGVLGVGAFVTATAGANVARDLRAATAATLAHEEAEASRRRGSNKLVVVRDLDVSYDGNAVLFGADLDLIEGEMVALLGTNGAGKSTLLRAISGLQQASNGAVFFDGEDITHRPPHLNARDGIVFLPGGRAIFPTLTVAENLQAAGWLYRETEGYLVERIAEVLTHFPILGERMEQLAGDLSGGEQQMLALGQCFIMRPRLLMIDELSLGLAPSIVETLLQIVRAINDQGTTVVLVEQSVNVALTVASRAVFMEKGRIAFDGPIGQLLARSDLVRAVFLGTGGASFAPGSLRRESARARERVLRVEDVAVSFGGVRALDGVSLEVGAGEVVGIIGPNGAGKTTLFDVVSGFVRPDAGVVTITDVVADHLSPAGRANAGLGRSFQNARLFGSLTVRENIAVALERHLTTRSAVAAAVWTPRVRASERRAFRRVEHVIGVLGLEVYADKFGSELSTGTRRMVDVACMMVAAPRILLLDEPSSGLAQAEIEVLGPVVQRFARETGAGVLVIEHDVPLVVAMSDRMVAMELGRVILEGEPDAVIADERVVGSYLRASDAIVHRSGDLYATTAAALGVAGASHE